MKFSFQDFINTRKNQFGRLGLWYILALSTIASVIIIGQLLIQNHLHDQLSDSRVVNIAGRQRMLSQKIAKLSLEIQQNNQVNSRDVLKAELQETVDLWKKSHLGLKNGDPGLNLPGKNSLSVTKMFSDIQPHFDEMNRIVAEIISLLPDPSNEHNRQINASIKKILNHEKPFLEGMDKIVYQYDLEARKKVSKLSIMEYVLLFISLLVILLEVLFIFRPTAANVNRTMSKLIESEKYANKMAKEISAIYSSLEKSYEQLAKVNEPEETPAVWARADRGGNIIKISDVYTQYCGVKFEKGMRICDIFPGAELGNDFMDDLVESISNHENWSDQLRITTSTIRYWVDITICAILDRNDEIGEVLVLGTDITSRKKAEKDMYLKNRSEVEKRINQQKYRSVLILEGQEEERNRLAMDIHDGIGQLLTSLKFQLEGINPSDHKSNVQKLQEIKAQLNDTIKEVRRVTFNLKPTVLGDYGLSAGLKLFIQEISKYSDLEITFNNPENLNERFSQRIENNVFRIVQEAINNAIKYAEAKSIVVYILKKFDEIIIQIKDDGKGFNPSKLHEVGIESGSGFFNMYERTEYINGKLEIDSIPGQGTTIELHVPLQQTVNT